MFSYAVASACYNYGITHMEDFVVLTREKQPSMYTKKRIYKALSETLKMSDDRITKMTKGDIFKCWGEDRFL